MVLQFSYFTIILCFILFIFMLFRLGKGSKLSSKLPPGPWQLPLIGNLHQMIGSQPHIVLRNLANKYGGLMYLQLGEIPIVVVSSREYAEEVMKTHDIIFASRPKTTAAKILTYNFTSITFSPYGEYWRKLRNICVNELLSMKRVQSLRLIRKEEVSKLIKSVYSKSGSPINLTDKIFTSTYNSISRIAIGERADKTNEIIPFVRELSRLMGGFNVVDVFPSIKLFHLISDVSSRLEKVNRKGSKILGDIIAQHIKAKAESKTQKKQEEEEEEEEEEDFVDVLLKFHGSDNEFTLTIDNIKAIIQDIFAAGGDTSSSTMDWTMVELIKHPRVMEKAQAEVRQVLHSQASFDETVISKMKYLKSVIKETLRLHPAAPLLLPRVNNERCEINGYEIPEKTRVLVNAWAIGRDPKCWGVDSERFNPERFVDSSVDFKGKNFEYIPFGAGRRMCPGMAFGLANVELVLSQLLFHFDWKLPNGMTSQDLDMIGSFGVGLRRRDELFLIPTPYDSSLISNP